MGAASIGVAAAGAFVAMFATTSALADTGVSEERVVLPDGPGSIGGVGENAEVDPNMGAMNYRIPIEVPAGFPGLTPELALRYSSAAGASVVGIGWSMPEPAIERMSLYGLPEYTQDDRFAVDSSDELVRVETGTNELVYRARFEGAFVRYRWVNPGPAGYWKAEYADGSVGYFGADENGQPVANARVTRPGDGGVFRYHLVVKVDRFGHRQAFTYTKDGEHARVDSIGYVYGRGGTTPRFTVRFEYEARPDPISSAIPGFNLLLSTRLSAVRVLSDARQIRRYALAYEAEELSGGMSRLARVTRYGLDDRTPFPVEFRFGYSRALVGTCAVGCEQPYMVSMGSVSGVNLASGRATLIDINGDALPDILNSSPSGEHTFYLAELPAAGGSPSFGAGRASTATTGGSEFVLSAPGVQVLDVNGDGLTDIVASGAGQAAVLCNAGSGDWDGSTCLANPTFPPLAADGQGEPNPRFTRFIDFDGDKRIDLLRTPPGAGTIVYRNTGQAFIERAVTDIGESFDLGTLQLADMNGDGLQDPVRLLQSGATGGTVEYRINLGYGQWAPWASASVTGVSGTDFLQADLEDLNGDGLADLVVVSGSTVRFALNRGANRFDAFRAITSAEVAGAIPTRTETTTVLFADMNGTGSNDVVWITQNGQVDFLELFPVKPNLLSRIENGIGAVQEITYGTSVAEQARDAGGTAAWTFALPHAMNVVTESDSWVTLTGQDNGVGVHEVVTYRYRNGFYDGALKAFRGYQRVEQRQLADLATDSQEPSLTVLEYNVGDTQAALNGKLERRALFVGATEDTALREERFGFGLCPLAGVPTNLSVSVDFACEQQREVVLQERAPEADWVTTREERTYDGYGNVTRLSQLGVVGYGPAGTAMCPDCASGAQVCGNCTGDERYTDTEYIDPGAATGNAWILGRASRTTVRGAVPAPAEETTETLIRYDGEPFVGLPAGTLTDGLVSSVRSRFGTGADDFVFTTRRSYNLDGQLAAELDPLGAPNDTTDHRRAYSYGPLGLNLTRVEAYTSDAEGPYQLRRDTTYDPVFNLVSKSTAWMVVAGGTVSSAENATQYAYDDFGRIAKIARPGDNLTTPTQEFTYQLADPASRIVVRSRSVTGGSIDLEEFRCVDGKGREFQGRLAESNGQYLVTGFRVFNRRGAPVRVYQPFRNASSLCSTELPPDGAFTQYRYDGAFRPVEITYPDEGIYQGASTSRTVFGPLTATSYDEVDGDAQHAAKDTPTIRTTDGLGRLVSIERTLSAGGTPVKLRMHYDRLSRLAGYTDAAGDQKQQFFDLLGRVIDVRDPNSGNTRFVYDAAGNVVSRTDATGATLTTRFDGLNRPVVGFDAADEAGTKVEWAYDRVPNCAECTNAAGRIAQVRYPLGAGLGGGIDQFGYDQRGLSTLSARSLEGHRFITRNTYDNASRLIATTYPDGTVLPRSYDLASRLTAIGGSVNSIAYDARGQLQTVTLANGLVSDRQYDQRMRLARLRALGPDGAVLQGAQYERDRVGNVVGIRDLSATRAGRPNWNTAIQYDAWYRPVNIDFDAGGEQAETVTYAYDNIDNLLSATSSLGAQSPAQLGDLTYSKTKPNAVELAGSLAYTLDAAGRVIARGDSLLERDYQGRLVNVSGPTTGRFIYGPGEGRVMKLEEGGVVYYAGPNFEVRDGISALYVRVGRDVVARRSSATLATTVLDDLAPQGSLDSVINAADAFRAEQARDETSRYLRSAARRTLLEAGDSSVYFAQDQLGSLTLATDAQGNVRGERAYHAFGATRFETGYVDVRGFSGQERDESSGLIHYRFRHLDPIAGRWASPDPAFLLATPENLGRLGEATTGYAYVANNPFNFVDPTGLGGQSASAAAKPSLKSRIAAKIPKPLKTRAAKEIATSVALGAATGAVSGAIFGGLGAGPGAAVGALVGLGGGIARTIIRKRIERRGQTRDGAIANTRLANGVFGRINRRVGQKVAKQGITQVVNQLTEAAGAGTVPGLGTAAGLPLDAAGFAEEQRTNFQQLSTDSQSDSELTLSGPNTP